MTKEELEAGLNSFHDNLETFAKFMIVQPMEIKDVLLDSRTDAPLIVLYIYTEVMTSLWSRGPDYIDQHKNELMDYAMKILQSMKDDKLDIDIDKAHLKLVKETD